MLRLRVCLNMCHHFDALPGASSHLSLLPTRRATIKHTRLLRIARPIKITCCTSGNWTDTENATVNGLSVFLAGFLSISTTAESGILRHTRLIRMTTSYICVHC